VCVVSCSLEAFWSWYSILKFPWKKIIKKKLQQKKEKKQKEQKSNNKEGALCVFSFLLCGGALWLPLCSGSLL
jgi:hypothetical protein